MGPGGEVAMREGVPPPGEMAPEHARSVPLVLRDRAQHRPRARTQGDALRPPPEAAVGHLQAKRPKGDVVLVRHKPSRRYRLCRCARDFYAWVARRPRIYTLGRCT